MIKCKPNYLLVTIKSWRRRVLNMEWNMEFNLFDKFLYSSIKFDELI